MNVVSVGELWSTWSVMGGNPKPMNLEEGEVGPHTLVL